LEQGLQTSAALKFVSPSTENPISSHPPASASGETDCAFVTLSSGKKHMVSRRLTFAAALGALVVSLQTTAAKAQYYDGCGSCGAVAAQPIAHCTPIQPVQATCYQTVPVTTYTREKQTVEVPTYETAYEDREVTVMRPVSRTRTVEVPTVSYQNVTEYRTVNKDMGRWTTSYHPIAKCAPCQVDPRPGVIGWMNRTGYSMRNAFTPNYTTSRQYVPNMVTCSVPYTRQVAIQGTRQVAVQETEMVAERKMERVPVQKLVMKREEVTVMRPQTAYRTVPIGTSMAYGSPFIGGTQMAYGGYPYYGGSQMAYGYPIIDSTATRSALAPQPDPIGSGSDRSAFKADDEDTGKTFKRSATDDGTIRGSSLRRSAPLNDDEPAFPSETRRGSEKPGDLIIPAVYRKQNATETVASKPTSTRSSGWRASRKTSESNLSLDNALSKPTISMSDSRSEK